VVDNAIKAPPAIKMINRGFERTAVATNVSGWKATSSTGKTPAATNPTKAKSPVTMNVETIVAKGISFVGFLHSPLKFTIVIAPDVAYEVKIVAIKKSFHPPVKKPGPVK
jgi:hypothetical protein